LCYVLYVTWSLSYRLQKINELIKRELGKILLEEGDFGAGILVTVLRTQTTEDFKEAAVTFSVLPATKGPAVLKNLSSRLFFIQRQLNKKLKMHPVPKIRFILNVDEAESQRVDELLHNLEEE